jgi:cytochrome P450
MAPASVFEQVLDQSSRADPYPLYGELRREPVSRQEDGSYVVSTYLEIVALLHDPRVSSDGRNLSYLPRTQPPPVEPGESPPFIRLDPPEHDRIRRLVMYHFGPPHLPNKIDNMRPQMADIIGRLVDGLVGRTQADIVEDIAHPFPVIVICRLLGVPREDESRFRTWADTVAEGFGPGAGDQAERERTRADAMQSLKQYLGGLAEARRASPGDDMISGFVTYDGPDGRLSNDDVESAGTLLLIAGHETTVNLISNGVLTLLRHPEVVERLKSEPELVIGRWRNCSASSRRCTSRCCGPPSMTSRSREPPFPKAPPLCWHSPLAAAIRAASVIPSNSIPTGTRTSTWVSAVASTTASARHWPGSRLSSR